MIRSVPVLCSDVSAAHVYPDCAEKLSVGNDDIDCAQRSVSAARCKLYDPITRFEMVVDGQYDSSEQIRCVTKPHPPDALSSPEFIGLGSSLLDAGGVFTGKQTVEFIVEIGPTASQFKYLTTPSTSGGTFSAPFTMTGDWQALEEGVLVRLPGAGYVVGDSWAFTAHHMDMDNLNDHPEIEIGSIKPGVVKHVYVSNDAGVTWSKQGTGATRFLFSDVYVSPSGDDVTGEGTWALPYKTIQRGIQSALGEPRSGFYKNSLVTGETFMGPSSQSGFSGQVNRDSIVLLDGRYSGVGNTGLYPMGKMLVVSAAHRGAAVIDCEQAATGDIFNGDRFAAVATTGHATLRGVNVESCAGRFAAAFAAAA
mmetsp:Transcript_16558/g.54059  ORF Transcript_16558/g.54059 Transcript_16558/m.54059 type:complete len:366 (-) Transcript_16558:828-1925(-)